MGDDDSLEDFLREWFEPIFSYTEDRAILDGLLLPFFDDEGDTRHRITAPAFLALSQYQRAHHRREASLLECYHLFYEELKPLIPVAETAWRNQLLLQTDYAFHITNDRSGQRIWYLPNETGGITMMLPEDY